MTSIFISPNCTIPIQCQCYKIFGTPHLLVDLGILK